MEKKQLVIFNLEKELYGFPITAVKEIIKSQKINKVPQMPNYMEGITNLRGNIVTIINLRKRFGLPKDALDENKKIIVLNDSNTGFIVDDVSEIKTVEEEDIDSLENMKTSFRSGFISNAVKIKDRIVVILDAERILNEEEKQEAEKIASST